MQRKTLIGSLSAAYRQRLFQRYDEAQRRLETDPALATALREEDALWSASDSDGVSPSDDRDESDGVVWRPELEDSASWWAAVPFCTRRVGV